MLTLSKFRISYSQKQSLLPRSFVATIMPSATHCMHVAATITIWAKYSCRDRSTPDSVKSASSKSQPTM